MVLLRRALLTVAFLAMTTGAFALVMLITVNAVGQAEILRSRDDRGQTYLLYLVPKHIARSTQARGTLDNADLAALEALPQVNAIALWERRTVARVELRQRGFPPSDATFVMPPMLGRVNPALKDVMGLRLADGRFIDAVDLQHNRPVCVIGARLHRRLGGGRVIGEELTIETIGLDGSRPSRVTETFSVVGVLQEELPLLAALQLSDRSLWNSLPRLIDGPRPGQHGTRAFEALQREQLVISRLAINDTVFIPWTANDRIPPLTSDTLVYLSVSVPNAPGSLRPIIDQETMEPALWAVPSEPGEEREDAARAGSLLPYYMPQGLMDVVNAMRAVLRSRLGEDKLFQFMHMETLGDAIRFELRWLNRLLGAIIIASLFLSSVPLIAGAAILGPAVTRLELKSGEDALKGRGIRRKAFYGYTGVCVFSLAVAIVAGAVLSYWLVTRVLLWH